MNNNEAICWQDGTLALLDQRLLPGEVVYLELRSAPEVAGAISDLVVRGAPAIGITAAWAAVLSIMEHSGDEGWRERVAADLEGLRKARPTAVNLAWAVDRMSRLIDSCNAEMVVSQVTKAALDIHQSDIAANHTMGNFGAALIKSGSQVLTHCNAGALATGGYGTALGVIRSAFKAGNIHRVFAGETRPWLQGARLTAWELLQDEIPVTLVAEGAVAHLMLTQDIDWLIVGADRIAANGDVANKVGTYSAALHARTHGARVMVAAPLSTIDLQSQDGQAIPLENRSPEEMLSLGGVRVAASGSDAWNPVFDITPAALVDAIVTERGVALPPFSETLASLFEG
jgi:methylthioribose-1-phosphate isomerase